ncbi:MAG: isochorismatase family protein [Janthinobacterium lividum]
MQVGLVHGPDKTWRGPALIDILNGLMRSAREIGAPIFLARHIRPAGSAIEPGSPLTELVQELELLGNEVIFDEKTAQCFRSD